MKAPKHSPDSFVLKYREERARRIRSDQTASILAFYPESEEAKGIVHRAHENLAKAGRPIPTREQLGLAPALQEAIAESVAP